jgi:hypothetical protein
LPKSYQTPYGAVEVERHSTSHTSLSAEQPHFCNHHQMHYAEALSQYLPIGLGAIKAGCKVIIKARLGAAGMKWNEQGVAIVLSLRTLSYSQGRWQQFWSKVNRYGFNLAET